MKPSVKDIAFDSNENSTNTYFYITKHGRVCVQFSWQTCKPNAHFIHKSMQVNNNFWNCYPLELSYDWYYDYHVHDIRLGRMKYHQLPDDIAQLLHHRVVRFDTYTKPPFKNGHNLIGYRNHRIIKILNRVCGFRVSLNPPQSLISYDINALNKIIDIVRTDNDSKIIMGKQFRNISPFSIDTPKQDIIMALTGYGFTAVDVMRKLNKAHAEFAKKLQPVL